MSLEDVVLLCHSKLINIFSVFGKYIAHSSYFRSQSYCFREASLILVLLKNFLELIIIIIISIIIIIFITIRIFVDFISLFQITESSQTNVVNRFNSLLNANHSRLQYSLSKNFPPLAH